jgi:hypothetical protein
VKRDEVGSILQKYHDDPLFGSHQGRDKMLAAIQKNFYWFGMKKDIEDYIKKCEICTKYKPTVTKPPLTPIVSKKPLERIIIDFADVKRTHLLTN